VWDLNSYRTTGLGGSETCAGRLAQTAAANGHRVTLFGEHIRASQDGVDLVPWREFDARDWEFDLFIASRALAPITPELRASKVLVWAHDCMLLSGQEISAAQRGMVDKFICLSPWHAQHFAQYHGLNESEITLIPNGVNVELFKPPQLKSKVFGKLIWSSSSDRGLDNVLYCLPWIKDRIPEVHLDIYNDYQVWEKLNKARGDEEAARRLGELQDNIARASEYAHWKGRVSQPELAKAWHEAYIWGYPTAWAETYCITAKEAQVSATPIVCSNAAALQTTVGEHGLRIEEDPYSVEGRTKFINAITMLCRDRETWEMFSEYSLGGAYRVDWKSRWEDYWQHWLHAAAT
jgi:glycosyltransferase involved in cell wall biosynthesis